jgi:ABC-type oligopeptide transport system substrate-binding subunit
MDVRLNLPGRNDIEVRAALSMISDASEILHKLLEGGHSTVAGRLAEAFSICQPNTDALGGYARNCP